MRSLLGCGSLLAGVLSLLPGERARAQLVAERPVQEAHARAGERYTGTIRVRNPSSEPQEARLYLTDYQFFADGHSLFAGAGTSERSNAPWIRIPDHILVPPRGEALVPYSVTVPPDSLRPRSGVYWSTVMIEPIARQVEGGIRTVTRYAVQIVTHLPGGQSRAELTGTRVVRTPGGRMLEQDIGNTGSSGYRLGVTLELYDSGGNLAAKLNQQRGLLFPGSSIRLRFALPPLAPGEYQALLVADTGSEDVFGARFRLTM